MKYIVMIWAAFVIVTAVVNAVTEKAFCGDKAQALIGGWRARVSPTGLSDAYSRTSFS
jgi:hypothetical protein